MIVVLSDTHADADPGIGGGLARAIRQADVVVHAGDFIAVTVYEQLQDSADTLYAVHGNADELALRDRLPNARVFESGGVRFAVTHTQTGGEMGLRYFGREEAADVVIPGHTHRPLAKQVEDVLLLNPGSHADPRGGHPTYATLDVEDGSGKGAIHTTDGSVLSEFALEGRDSISRDDER